MRKQYEVFFLGLLAAILADFASVGTGSISLDRLDYNEMLTESWKWQILHNIVKMRYIEHVFLLMRGRSPSFISGIGYHRRMFRICYVSQSLVLG